MSDEHSLQADNCKIMLIELNQETPNELLNNVLSYISEFIVRSLLLKLKCRKYISQLLLNADDLHSFKALEYPICDKFTFFEQKVAYNFLL